MNKILVSRNNIISDSNKVMIDNNRIRLLESDMYFIEYDDIDDINLYIEIDNGINVLLYESSFLNNIRVNNKYIVYDGRLKVNKFYNNDNVIENIDIDLCSIGSSIDYRFSSICTNNERYVFNINHKNINTKSNISNKSIALDGCKLDFVINSIVKKEYEKSILDQTTRVITMGNSDVNISPNMFIDCDDIEARHGSVVGTFKDELVFYLMSRGISYNDAIKLLIKGYLFSNVDANDEMKEKILNIIDMYWR